MYVVFVFEEYQVQFKFELVKGYWCSRFRLVFDVWCYYYYILYIHILLYYYYYYYYILYYTLLIFCSISPPLFFCSSLPIHHLFISFKVYVSAFGYTYLYSIIPIFHISQLLTPHVLSWWMVEVCRFDKYVF